MPALDLFLHNQFVGVVEPAPRDKTRVTLSVDNDYHQQVLLSEAFAALPGRRANSTAVSNFLGGYVPEGNHRERMAAKRQIEKDDLFALLREFGGSIDGEFDHRHISADRILAEIESWDATPTSRAAAIVTETLTALDHALAVVNPPAEASPGMVERLQRNTGRLLAGTEIGEP